MAGDATHERELALATVGIAAAHQHECQGGVLADAAELDRLDLEPGAGAAEMLSGAGEQPVGVGGGRIEQDLHRDEFTPVVRGLTGRCVLGRREIAIAIGVHLLPTLGFDELELLATGQAGRLGGGGEGPGQGQAEDGNTKHGAHFPGRSGDA